MLIFLVKRWLESAETESVYKLHRNSSIILIKFQCEWISRNTSNFRVSWPSMRPFDTLIHTSVGHHPMLQNFYVFFLLNHRTYNEDWIYCCCCFFLVSSRSFDAHDICTRVLRSCHLRLYNCHVIFFAIAYKIIHYLMYKNHFGEINLHTQWQRIII